MGGAPVRIKCEVEISAILNYAIVHQLAFFAFVCITQLFLALRYEIGSEKTCHVAKNNINYFHFIYDCYKAALCCFS